ncbi:sigma factor-like helix-turn-helix DNA-binding protein [Clostridium sp.]|uniref:sigma factor-like helix-turn-helix DNA-binding protein n=1 Tax=Clostridium sp. TaxID=1506 RepID=UPI00345CB66B
MENNNDRQALILKMYSEGYTFADIGYMLDMSRQRANLIFKKTIDKIRNKYRIEVM